MIQTCWSPSYKQSFPLKVSDEPLVKLYLVFGAAATEKSCFCKTRTFYRKGQSGCWRTNHVPPAEPRAAVAVLSNTQQTSERHKSPPTSYTTTQRHNNTTTRQQNTKQNGPTTFSAPIQSKLSAEWLLKYAAAAKVKTSWTISQTQAKSTKTRS